MYVLSDKNIDYHTIDLNIILSTQDFCQISVGQQMTG